MNNSPLPKRQTYLLYSSYSLLFYAIYSYALPFWEGNVSISDPILRARHFVSVFPVFFIASALFISQNSFRSTQTIIRRIAQSISILILVLTIVYFVLIPSVIIGRLTEEKRIDYNLSQSTSILFQQKDEILQSIKGIQDPASFSVALRSFPAITNLSIRPGTPPDAIRRGIESALDQSIDQQLKTLKNQQSIQKTLLSRTSLSSIVGCLISALSLLMLNFKLFGWPNPFNIQAYHKTHPKRSKSRRKSVTSARTLSMIPNTTTLRASCTWFLAVLK